MAKELRKALDKADENGGDVDSDSEGEEADSEAALSRAVREAEELEADDEMSWGMAPRPLHQWKALREVLRTVQKCRYIFFGLL